MIKYLSSSIEVPSMLGIPKKSFFGLVVTNRSQHHVVRQGGTWVPRRTPNFFARSVNSYIFIKSFLPAAVFAVSFQAKISDAAVFDINELPVGRNVTLLKPATTVVPLATRTTLGATDLPQMLKFEVIADVGNQPNSIRVAIYDSTRERVRYIDIKPGVPFVYSFSDLDTVLVIPQIPKEASNLPSYRSTKLQIESDKPLSVGR
jgi:hypothetical protein